MGRGKETQRIRRKEEKGRIRETRQVKPIWGFHDWGSWGGQSKPRIH